MLYLKPDDLSHASGANLDIAMIVGYFVNSFTLEGRPAALTQDPTRESTLEPHRNRASTPPYGFG